MEVFDAILADPPYGVRAGARKSVHAPHRNRRPDRFCEFSRQRRVMADNNAGLTAVSGTSLIFLNVRHLCRVL